MKDNPAFPTGKKDSTPSWEIFPREANREILTLTSSSSYFNLYKYFVWVDTFNSIHEENIITNHYNNIGRKYVLMNINIG